MVWRGSAISRRRTRLEGRDGADRRLLILGDRLLALNARNGEPIASFSHCRARWICAENLEVVATWRRCGVYRARAGCVLISILLGSSPGEGHRHPDICAWR